MSNKIIRFRGDTYAVEAVLSKDGIPIDLTDGTSAQFSFVKGDIKFTIPGLNPSVNGEVSFAFPADVKAGIYKYDIQVIEVSNEIRTYVKDVLEILGDITT